MPNWASAYTPGENWPKSIAFLTIRSCIHAELTLDTERGTSMMFRSSPMTSPTGRTVGRTWSEMGTSLTVYFSRVVTGPVDVDSSVVDAEVATAGLDDVGVGVGVGVGAGVCARSPAHRIPNPRMVAGT